MGCPYESKYAFDGKKIRYDQSLLGNWHEGKADLKISKVDDYKFSFTYNDHDDSDEGSGEVTGTGYAVSANGSTYLVVEKNTYSSFKFLTYKVMKVSGNRIELIALDEDRMGTTKTFSSGSEFTRFVTSSSSLFPSYASSVFERGIATTTSYTNSNDNAPASTYTSSNVLFSDDFQTNKNGWYSNYVFKDSNYIYIATLDGDNHYLLFRNRVYKGSYIIPFPYTMATLSGYSIQIRTKHHDGVEDSGYGFKFAASDWSNSYNLHISANGYYRISKNENSNYSELIAWTKNSSLNTGQNAVNTLEVRVYYNYFDLYINSQYITRVNNFSAFGKYAGLEVFNNQTIDYDDLLIKKL